MFVLLLLIFNLGIHYRGIFPILPTIELKTSGMATTTNHPTDSTATSKTGLTLQEQVEKQKATCGPPRPTVVRQNRAGIQYLTPGHQNCTMGWIKGINFGQNTEDAIIYQRFFSGKSPLAYLGKQNGAAGSTAGTIAGGDDNNNEQLPRGIVLEMGALDGVTFSNSLLYEQCLGWEGILIEAEPNNFAKLKHNRPCAVKFGEAVCSSSSSVQGRTGPSSICMSSREGGSFDLSTRPGSSSEVGVEVPCRPLSTILSELGVTRINFFSLDVGGSELKVLETIDWNAVKIDVLMVDGTFLEKNNELLAVRSLVEGKGKMKRVPSRLDIEDPETGNEYDPKLCQRGEINNCRQMSIAGSEVFVSPELYKYDTEPWTFR